MTKGQSRPATIPQPDPDWHPIALMLWNAALESGQADFYESSDAIDDKAKLHEFGKAHAWNLQRVERHGSATRMRSSSTSRIGHRLAISERPATSQP